MNLGESVLVHSYTTISFKAFHFLKLLSSCHHIGSQDTIFFDHVKLLAIKLNNFSFAVHSVVQGHFNGATRRRTTAYPELPEPQKIWWDKPWGWA